MVIFNKSYHIKYNSSDVVMCLCTYPPKKKGRSLPPLNVLKLPKLSVSLLPVVLQGALASFTISGNQGQNFGTSFVDRKHKLVHCLQSLGLLAMNGLQVQWETGRLLKWKLSGWHNKPVWAQYSQGFQNPIVYFLSVLTLPLK